MKKVATKWKDRAKEDRANREQIKKNQRKILEDMTREEKNMIRAEELRRNCYVNWNGEYGKVKAIYEDEVLFYCGEECLISDLTPIPLTEEILLKCGFAPIITDELPQITEYTMEYRDYTYIIIFRMADIDWRCSFWINDVPVKYFGYVHQLQNLYHALTGQELPINIKTN
jgi:hypothetical protein